SSLETFAVGYSAWKAKRQAEANHGDVSISKIFPKYFGNTSETFPSGIGIGVGVGSGSGDGEKPFAQSDQEHRSVQVPTVFDLPLIGGKQYGVPQKLYDEYIKAFPGVSVMDELAKLRVWLLSNPKRMKTLTGMPRCMNSWLSKAQNNQPHGRSNYGNLPVGKADRNLAVLNEVLGRGQRQDGLDEVGLLSAGGDGQDDS
ncbi:MAG TPA: hypothetical protein VK638_00185, partial [Edaphobacter sp.]|nr:hypothetical protein [Edaphobacter sp.]